MAVYDLRLSEELFWSLTPVEFDAITKRYMQDEERTDRRYALTAFVMASAWSAKSKYKIEDFMLHDFGQKKNIKTDWQKSLSTLKQQVSQIKK